MDPDWLIIQQHYENCLEVAGVTPQGVDWPNGSDLEARFATQLSVLGAVPPSSEPPSLLDLGCGPGLLLDYLEAKARRELISYYGIDISSIMIEAARSRWPGQLFEARDILTHPLSRGVVDVVVMNGLLTERRGIPYERMVKMAEAIISASFKAARHGIAFNVMSRHVEWERDDLFHWGYDEVASFLYKDLTRHIAIRADYGLYEFTVFAWHQPQRPMPCRISDWWIR